MLKTPQAVHVYLYCKKQLMRFCLSAALSFSIGISFTLSLGIISTPAHASYQREEQLAESVRTLLRQSILTETPRIRPFLSAADYQHFAAWYHKMDAKLKTFQPDPQIRQEILLSVDYEAMRAGLNPNMVMGVIYVESRFKPKAKSVVGARGMMQVMPFWSKVIGDGDVDKLNNIRTNIRYGCVILRYYMDKENGNLTRALARYNGSLGKTKYPNKVYDAMKKWQ